MEVGDNWSYKSCKAPVKSSPPTNQHPVFYRPDALPVAQPTVSKHWREKYHIPWTYLPPSSPWGLPTLSLITNSSWLLLGGLPCLSSALWCQYPRFFFQMSLVLYITTYQRWMLLSAEELENSLLLQLWLMLLFCLQLPSLVVLMLKCWQDRPWFSWTRNSDKRSAEITNDWLMLVWPVCFYSKTHTCNNGVIFW